MTGILAAYRQSFLSEGPWLPGVSLSVAVAFAVLAAGLLLFRRVEGRFGDVL
jgi:ABC-type polysaccharide/polyol phosphate export permease